MNQVVKNMKKNGYVALISVMVLSAILLLIAIGFGTKTLYARKGLADIEFKEVSYFVAHSCLDKALFELSLDFDYGGDEVLMIDEYQCEIEPIVKMNSNGLPTKKGKNRYIKVSSDVQDHKTTLEVFVDENLTPITFKET